MRPTIPAQRLLLAHKLDKLGPGALQGIALAEADTEGCIAGQGL
jgi:hypothetical protein